MMKTEEPQQSEEVRKDGPAVPRQSTRPGIGIVVLAIVAAVAIGWFIYKGITARVAAEGALERQSKTDALLTVSVTHPTLASDAQELSLPGNTQPFKEASINARTSGYLKHWYADIGVKVHTGQLLADIETPEVDQQLQQARADLETAQANLALARTTAVRWQSMLKTESVSQQEADEKTGDLNAKKAIVDSASANVRRLENLQSYEKVYAPFDGVITARNTDVGALIGADTTTSGHELFHVAAIDRLRVFISVPEEYERAAKSGAKATLTLSEFPGRTFTGTVARNANSIDPTSRTLLVEIDVNNPTGDLLPGAYVTVRLPVAGHSARAMTIPANTLLFRSEGLRVAVVHDGKAQLTSIQVGRDFGETLEIVSGLKPGDDLIVNPPDSIVTGAAVRIINGAKD